MPADIDESHVASEYVKRMVFEKYAFISQQYPDDLVSVSDTIVVDYGEILGKHTLREAGFQMLKSLSGATRLLYIAVTMQ